MIKIFSLIDNISSNKNLKKEHGLSFYIEAYGNKLLFDTGASDKFIKNAQKLKIDLKDVSSLILSHGHYDHTGGIKRLLQINPKIKIFIKKEAFKAKFHKKNEYIGIPKDLHIIKNFKTKYSEVFKLCKNVYIVSKIHITDKSDTHFNNMYLANGKIDNFIDEQVLVITSKKGLIVVTGCSHRGIINICKYVKDIFKQDLSLVIGGLHLSHESKKNLLEISKKLANLKAGKFLVCHCTGYNKYNILKQYLPNIEYFDSGSVCEVNH